MKPNSSDNEGQKREKALDMVGCSNNQDNNPSNDTRRHLLKGVAVTVLSTLGISSATNAVAATPGENVEISEAKATKTIAEKRDRLDHLAANDVIHEVDIGTLVSKLADQSSDGGIQAEIIRDHEGNVQPSLTVTVDGPIGEVTMGFPLRSDVAFFDLPDSVDAETLASSWNDQLGASSCPEGNDSCCCNVSSCDYCHCTYYGYCDCTNVAGETCWYQYCDCCADITDYCTRYCGSPLSYNC